MASQTQYSFTQDLDELFSASDALWDTFRHANLFITGGTGFFGRWLLESFLLANQRKNLKASVTVLSRNPVAFAARVPHLAKDASLQFWPGDVRNFVPPAGEFSHIIHAATESSGMQKHHSSLHMSDTIVEGTRRVLDFARNAGTPKMVYISSGAVYGRSRSQATPISENDKSAPIVTENAIEYDESKRMAEALCVMYQREFGLNVSIARCFSFVGPYLPMDEHFAIGNFIDDAVKGGPIRVNSAGTAIRSYLYAADLARWIWTILAQGKPTQAYNVGSDAAVSIADLARIVGKTIDPSAKVEIKEVAPPGALINYQVPDIRRAQEELGLRPLVSLEEAIRRTAAWHRDNKDNKNPIDKTPPVIVAPDVVVFDFDGVMTDNRVVVSETGKESVFCNRSDGLGIAKLRDLGVPMLVLSTEKNLVVAERCKKLKLECLQGIDAKEEALAEWLKQKGYQPARTIYVGNDINDLGCLRLVGYPVVVSDAYPEAKALAQLILSRPGGKGAVRELADIICAARETLLE